MPNDDSDLVYRAAIESLQYAATIAVRAQDSQAFSDIEDQLEALGESIDVPSKLRSLANRVHDSLALDMTSQGLASMSAIVASLAGATAELQKATAIAKDGKGALSVPALAEAAKKALTSFNDLKSAADKLGKDLDSGDQAKLQDVPSKLKTLVSDVQNLQDVAKG